jgi:O-antigen/teichoic acid export membrane protein
MSFADLGISSAIIYRIYQPLSRDDTERVGQLMRFFKKANRMIAFTIFAIGCLIALFLPSLIKDSTEIPKDINIYLVFFLFLLQSVSSYLFTYKLTMFDVDQKQYLNTLINTGTMAVRSLVQIIILVILRNYILSLLAGTVVTVISNMLSDAWVTKKFPQVFTVRTDITSGEKKGIYRDTFAAICHKIGGVIITSTDSILLSKYIGLIITGIYSNYAMILSSITEMVAVLFGPFTAALGNAHATEENDGRYRIYKRSMFVNFWIVGLITTCLFLLVNDFIILWLGEGMILDFKTVVFLCVQFYIVGTRKVSEAYMYACGLFVRDKARPAVEAALNIIFSIILLRMFGVAGVFAGTVISCLLTTYWREPYLLYKYVFYRSSLDFWIINIRNALVIVLTVLIVKTASANMFSGNMSMLQWIMKGLLSVFTFEVIHSIVFIRNEDFHFALSCIGDLRKRIKP